MFVLFVSFAPTNHAFPVKPNIVFHSVDSRNIAVDAENGV